MTPSVNTDNWFTCTSKEPYDRHHYRLQFNNKKSIKFEDYELMRAAWFEWCNTGALSHVDVLDVTKVRASSPQGF